jgi:hypothetical protein
VVCCVNAACDPATYAWKVRANQSQAVSKHLLFSILFRFCILYYVLFPLSCDRRPRKIRHAVPTQKPKRVHYKYCSYTVHIDLSVFSLPAQQPYDGMNAFAGAFAFASNLAPAINPAQPLITPPAPQISPISFAFLPASATCPDRRSAHHIKDSSPHTGNKRSE